MKITAHNMTEKQKSKGLTPKEKRKSRMFAILGAVLLAIIWAGASYVETRIGEAPSNTRAAAYITLPNYKDAEFQNEEPAEYETDKVKLALSIFRFLTPSKNNPKEPLKQIALTKNSFEQKPAKLAATWLGHSMIIFELNGARFITDPVFGNAAPVPFVAGRYADAPISREDLPKLDFVLISHDHYDHLEYETVRFFKERGAKFVVPLGVGARLEGWGVPAQNITELNWNESTQLAGIKITALPARHFSGREKQDKNKTLWASFVFEGGGKKIFFGADGGYGKHFKKIGETYAPFDLICLEIDAWNVMWPNNHLYPPQVIQAYADLKGGGKAPLLPIHWGVFDMADHPWDESITQVKIEAAKANVPLVEILQGGTFKIE